MSESGLQGMCFPLSPYRQEDWGGAPEARSIERDLPRLEWAGEFLSYEDQLYDFKVSEGNASQSSRMKQIIILLLHSNNYAAIFLLNASFEWFI